MRFKDFLQENTRFTYPHVNTSSKEEVVEWIRQHCKGHVAGLLRGGTPIWRGMNIGSPSDDQSFGVGDASKFKRKAANTNNFINLIVSNSSRWRDYPKRESAYICTTDLNVTHNFGDPYLVIPADDAPIGVVPSFDFWYGFKSLHRIFKGLGVEMLNGTLEEICKRLNMPIDDGMSYDALCETLREISKDDITDAMQMEPDKNQHDVLIGYHFEYNRRIEHLIEKMHPRQSLLSYLEELLDPKESGFRHTTGDAFYEPKKFEVWIGGRVAFISISEISPDGEDGTPGNITARLKEWLNEV